MGDDLSSNREAASGLGLPRGGFDDLPGLQTEDRHVLRGAGGEPAAGPGEDQGVLARAAALKFPDLREVSGSERIDKLVEHINDTAIMRADLEQLRLEAHVRLLDAKRKYDRIPARTHRTRAAADESRRAADPELAEEIRTAQWLVDRCTEQINRLGGTDYDAASRTYTLLSGS